MSKEYLEALERLYKCNDDDYTLGYQQHDYKLLQQVLQRLEIIENAKPSEALKMLLEAKQQRLNLYGQLLYNDKIFFEALEPALFKAQENENKKYLKWEDLEFKEEEQKMKVILNGSIHHLCYFRNMFGTSLCIIDNTDITIRRENKDFFNDLHLGVAEDE